ncbi:Methylated-DNA--protein-cysteine methyltransferase, constitutive [Ralstonia wenshanensis]|uniref:methylated-DNA--[protein]-cysteine S-methyltransferase n=1 Tax=Ralstonia wenshanensis TaxID=2842456 RepID=UPI0028F5F404|nr:methylated-DNA--[protein]-cysteine S-methyltransferase [Ralstonia wenshanensis]CAJ0811734.1 Methylated-DNA--protein-cysteine methyltransferase, constitutive [Ralstonia wenshanensis]
MYRHTFACPLGDLLLTATDTHLTGAFFPGQKTIPLNAARMSPGADIPVIREAQAQFTAYFAGKLQDFNLPMAPQGTPFQQDVWRVLCNIAFGSRTTYGQITARLGLMREHARAVGTAVGRNPISIAIPCHRVVGADGALTGYAGGLPRKAALLRLEGHPARVSERLPMADDRRQGTLALLPA